ncbi:MAG: shikimate kinase [Clostridia bacterium]|nr:shikimate kinase [Clostridia bacterium]
MKENIVLIGMSGAGKTTIGLALSYKLKMTFVDMDSYIERKYNRQISEIFDEYGEEYFRKIETETAKEVSENYKNTIISTGGGVVLNHENMEYLKKCGTVVYINRTVENILSTLNAEKRPLLKANPEKLYEMRKIRHPLYIKYADICILNSGEFKDCVNNIAEALDMYK